MVDKETANGSSHVTNYCTKQRGCWLAQSFRQRKDHPMNFHLTNNQLKWRHPWKSSKSSGFFKGFGQELGKNSTKNVISTSFVQFHFRPVVVSMISVRFPRSQKIIGPTPHRSCHMCRVYKWTCGSTYCLVNLPWILGARQSQCAQAEEFGGVPNRTPEWVSYSTSLYSYSHWSVHLKTRN